MSFILFLDANYVAQNCLNTSPFYFNIFVVVVVGFFGGLMARLIRQNESQGWMCGSIKQEVGF